MSPYICHRCDALIERWADGWVRLDVMHHDRIGHGTLTFCSKACAATWLGREAVDEALAAVARKEGR